jgi:hypothetical protein
LGESRIFAQFGRNFFRKVARGDPKEHTHFLPFADDSNRLDDNDLKPDKLGAQDAVEVLGELRDRIPDDGRTVPFSKRIKRIGFVLLCHGHREDKFLHAIFGFPAVSTLWGKQQKIIDRMKEQLTVKTAGAMKTTRDSDPQNQLENSTIHANFARVRTAPHNIFQYCDGSPSSPLWSRGW